ncbi:hypothetical protein [Williamsia phyllosphaerae]|uniref:Uncharacterized protein n=1 Tax=Williamsia phyllosphaerae TaxID=885042 RepID=A0ABQ1V7S3_9NOCA|nr:hypothetical protein [Williamsia phyllosphaerae]GGF42994.1 hypothetical protein GCM10007298_43330 [Williamsia phyllosphaerae]
MGTLIIVVTAVLAVFVLLGGAWFAIDSTMRVRRFARSTDLVPGRPGRAPAEWTTSDSPEAVAHRRIRYAIATVHENPTLTSTPSVTAALTRLDDEVFALDDRLIAAAHPENADALRRIGFAVDELESLAGRLAYASPQAAEPVIDAAIAYLRDPVERPDVDADSDND